MSNNQTEANEQIANDFTVSYGTKIISGERLREAQFSAIINMIREGEGDLKERIEAVRKAVEEKVPKNRIQELKANTLPYFVPPKFRDGVRSLTHLISASHAVFDYDHLSRDKFEELNARFREDSRTLCLFTSPSGDGLKVMCKFPNAITSSEKYTSHYQAYSILLGEQYGVVWDKSTTDSSRACFLSYDPDIYVNFHATPLPELERPEESAITVANNGKKEEILALFEGVSDGSRTHSATKLIGLYISKGFDREMTRLAMQAWNKQNEPPQSEAEIDSTIDDMYDRYGKEAIQNERAKRWTIMAVESYLRGRYDFRMNLVTQQPEYRIKGEGEFVRVCDGEIDSLWRELHYNGLPIGIDPLRHILNSDFLPAVDPIKRYFDGLPEWDGTTDFIAALSETVTLKNESDKDAFKLSLRRWLIAQVACALDPSKTNHTALILVGGQGIGKSSWLNRLIPPALARYGFIGTINPDNKDTEIYLSEKMLINLDELETLRKAEIGSLKTIMTKPSISVRRPYAAYSIEMPRRASFVGSINNGEFLNDPTGSRRFLTYEVAAVNYMHTVDMDGVYAQAYLLFKAGERYWFNSEENAATNARNKAYMEQSYERELLLRFFKSGVNETTGLEWLTSTEIAKKISSVYEDFRPDAKSVRNLGYALNAEGFVSKKAHGGIKQYCVKKIGTWLE